MLEILDAVPGRTPRERAQAIGVSRQTVYMWMAERSRPAPMQARRLAELTGCSVADITGPSSRYSRCIKSGGAAKPARP